MDLDSSQEALIASALKEFRAFLDTDSGREAMEEREKRIQFFQRVLAKDHIDDLTEPDFSVIITELWASQLFSNKNYVVERILKSIDFATLRQELKGLLWNEKPIRERYDSFREKVSGLGPASITEILAHVRPVDYGLWNEKTRAAFRLLKIQVPFAEKYNISGEQYEACNEILKLIGNELEAGGLEQPDLVDVDYFLYFMVEQYQPLVKPEVLPRKSPEDDYDFEHPEIAEKLAAIGTGLGFDVDTNVKIAKGAQVDVLWTARIGNLGEVRYAFEIQRRGSVDSLILNLQRAKNNPSVQKLVVVANGKNIKAVQQEVSSLNEEFRKSLAFIEAREIQRAAELLTDLNSILSKLELVRSEHLA